MNKNRKQTSDMVKVALLSAIIVVLSFTPMGYIPLGFMNATTVHIPVIIGSILLGAKKGAFLGGIFGLSSMIHATVIPQVASFVFTPFYSVGDMHGNLWSLVVCFVPRILTGVVPYYVYRLCRKLCKKENLSIGIGAFCGSMTNTLLVMNFIYLFFGRPYAQINNTAFEGLYAVISAVILTNGVPEAIVACILTVLICKAVKSALAHKIDL